MKNIERFDRDRLANHDPRAKYMPADPESQNENRASWALVGLRAFAEETGCDFSDSVCDLLCDLMHFADRHSMSFADALERAQDHYNAETNPDA